MDKKIKEINKKGITREDALKKEKAEYEEKRLKFMQKARQENVAMAIELQKDMNKNIYKKENLRNNIAKAFNLTNKTNATLVSIQKVIVI